MKTLTKNNYIFPILMLFVFILSTRVYGYDSFYAKKNQRERQVFQALSDMEASMQSGKPTQEEQVKVFEQKVAQQAYQRAQAIKVKDMPKIANKTKIKQDETVSKATTNFEKKPAISNTTAQGESREFKVREQYVGQDNKFKNTITTQEQKQVSNHVKFKAGVGAGYRDDRLTWTIAGSNNVPNIISELDWDNVKSKQVLLSGEAVVDDQYVMEVKIGVGEVFSGNNQDSDFLGNNRTFEFSRSNNDASDGDVMDASLGLGVRMPMVKDHPQKQNGERKDLYATVLGGYSYHEQRFVMTDLNQTVETIYSIPLGSYPGLYSTYRTEWHGPWMGLKFEGEYEKFRGFTRMEYHWADYYGVGKWNLRNDLQHPKSYDHETDGRGIVWEVGGGYWLKPWWSLDLSYQIANWETNEGLTRFYLSSGAVGQQPFNEAIWESQAINLSSTVHF